LAIAVAAMAEQAMPAAAGRCRERPRQAFGDPEHIVDRAIDPYVPLDEGFAELAEVRRDEVVESRASRYPYSHRSLRRQVEPAAVPQLHAQRQRSHAADAAQLLLEAALQEHREHAGFTCKKSGIIFWTSGGPAGCICGCMNFVRRLS